MNIPFTYPPCPLASKSVAIVGSSCILTNSNMGEEIDNHIEVLRCNLAPTKGFEKDVGSRTTIRVSNPKFFSAETPNPYREVVPSTENARVLCVGPETKTQNFEAGRKILHPSSTAHKIDMSEAYRGFVKQPSVGMVAVSLLVKMGVRPNVYGFNGLDGLAKPDNLDEYYQPCPGGESPCHNILKERLLLLEWHNQGRIHWIDAWRFETIHLA